MARVTEVGIVAHDAGGVGGMETQIAQLALGLANRGYAVTVFAATCTFADQPGITWVRVPAPRAMALRLPWFALWGSIRVLLRRPDVLITTGAILPMRTDLAVVHFCHHAYRRLHGHRQPSRQHPLWRANARVAERLSLMAERWCYRAQRCGFLMAVSASTAEDLRHVPGRLAETVVAENGVDTRRFYPRPERRAPLRQELGLPGEARIALFVGGDWALKRPELAMAALAWAPEWHLVVVGPGDAVGVRRQAQLLGVAERVHLVGRQQDPYPYYLAADVFVHPSRTEAWGLVLLEAQSCGLPVVTTLDTSLTREMEARGSALRVPQTPQAIAAALRALRDPQARAPLARAGRAFAQTRDWSRTVDRFEEAMAQRMVRVAAPLARGDAR